MSIKWNYNKVKEYMNKEGYELLSKTYRNNREKLEVRCPYGHQYGVSCNKKYILF